MPGPPFMRHRPKKKYVYIPPPTSGAYVILVAMCKAQENEFIKNLTKQQVLDYCNRYSQSSLKDNSKIWACMKGLIDKSLVGRHMARDPIYFLLDEGRDLAQKLIAMAERKPIDDEDEASRESQAQGSQVLGSQLGSQLSQNFNSNSNSCDPEMMWFDGGTSFELKAGTFELVLIVDQREKIDIISLDNSVKIETRTLACGDFIWIARPTNTSPYDRTKDLVLDYVIERKRLDDLASSIFDGRFQQQKMRLQNTGVRRPVYLIEDCGSLRASNLTSAGLSQAVTNILTHDGIDVQKVKNPSHANDYLLSMTKCLERQFLNKNLRSCDQELIKEGKADKNDFMTFAEFQTKGAKITNWTVREMFAKHLIQITGMSDKRVAVIVKQYPTISALNDAYNACSSEKEKENLLSKLKIPDSNRTIGPALSRRVYVTYSVPKDWQADNNNYNLDEDGEEQFLPSQ